MVVVLCYPLEHRERFPAEGKYERQVCDWGQLCRIVVEPRQPGTEDWVRRNANP